VRKGGKIWGVHLTPSAVLQIVQHYARAMGLEKLAPHDMRSTCAKLCRKRGGDLEQNKISARPRVDSDHGTVFGGGAGFHNCGECHALSWQIPACTVQVKLRPL
jgi:hypothetical protein